MAISKYAQDKKRVVKAKITEAFANWVDHVSDGKKFKVYLCLPSCVPNCVKALKEKGLLDNAKIIAIEHNKDKLLRMRYNLHKAGFDKSKRQVINKSICDITTDDLITACKKLGVDGIDLAYIDSCNTIGDCMQAWLEDVLNNVLTDDAVVAFNATAGQGSNGWVQSTEQYRGEENVLTMGHKSKHTDSISACFADKLGCKKPQFVINYKEPHPAAPMVLTGITKKYKEIELDFFYENVLTLQGLGYKDYLDDTLKTRLKFAGLLKYLKMFDQAPKSLQDLTEEFLSEKNKEYC